MSKEPKAKEPKAWKPSHRFCPKNAQYTGGVNVQIYDGVKIQTVRGMEYSDPPRYLNVVFGGDGNGIAGRNQEEEERLLALAADPNTHICKWEDRERPKKQAEAERAMLKERKEKESLKAEIEAMKAAAEANGLSFENGSFIPRK